MGRNGPLYTLLTGGLFGAGLLVAAMVATPSETADDDEPAAQPTTTASPQPTPAPTVEPSPAVTATPTPVAVEDPEPVTYVGYVDGGAASVALIVTGDEAIAYVCDGASVEAWLDGTAVAGVLDLTGDGSTLTGDINDSGASGHATVGDLIWTFTIEEVEPPDGLYRFADTIAGGADVVGGWIVLPDGSQVGVLTLDGEPTPAPELDLQTGEVIVDDSAIKPERLG